MAYTLENFQKKVKETWEQTAFFTRFVVIISTIFLILNWIFPSIIINLVNVPIATFKGFKLWTLLTTSLINLRILNYAFGLFIWLLNSFSKEKDDKGTINYIICFFFHSINIQVVFLALSLAIGLFKSSMMGFPSAGLWPIILADLTHNCLGGGGNPNKQVLLYLVPDRFPVITVPFFLFIFIELINFFEVLLIDLLAGILYGCFHFFIIRNKLDLYLTTEFLVKIQDSFIIKPLKSFKSFVSISGSGSALISDVIPELPSIDNLKPSTTIGENASNMVANMKDSVSNNLTGMKDSASNAVSGVKDSASNIVSGVKETTTNVVSGVKDSVSGAAIGMKDGVTEVASNLKEKLTN